MTSHHTKIERNNLQPHWNERCTFEDVALSNNLTVAIFDHKKLSSDIFLGQVSLLSAHTVCMLEAAYTVCVLEERPVLKELLHSETG